MDERSKAPPTSELVPLDADGLADEVDEYALLFEWAELLIAPPPASTGPQS